MPDSTFAAKTRIGEQGQGHRTQDSQRQERSMEKDAQIDMHKTFEGVQGWAVVAVAEEMKTAKTQNP